jgi:hypothetical protein
MSTCFALPPASLSREMTYFTLELAYPPSRYLAHA